VVRADRVVANTSSQSVWFLFCSHESEIWLQSSMTALGRALCNIMEVIFFTVTVNRSSVVKLAHELVS